MPTYIVKEERMVVIEYEVEAASEDEAVAVAQGSGGGFEIDNYLYDCYVARTVGEE